MTTGIGSPDDLITVLTRLSARRAFWSPIIRRLTYDLGSTAPVLTGAECAMKAYSDFDGTRSENWRRPGLKWWKLGEACAAMGVTLDGAHRALADCDATRRLVLSMAAQATPRTEATPRQMALLQRG